jgi:hypothetical protein
LARVSLVLLNCGMRCWARQGCDQQFSRSFGNVCACIGYVWVGVCASVSPGRMEPTVSHASWPQAFGHSFGTSCAIGRGLGGSWFVFVYCFVWGGGRWCRGDVHLSRVLWVPCVLAGAPSHRPHPPPPPPSPSLVLLRAMPICSHSHAPCPTARCMNRVGCVWPFGLQSRPLRCEIVARASARAGPRIFVCTSDMGDELNEEFVDQRHGDRTAHPHSLRNNCLLRSRARVCGVRRKRSRSG